MNKLIFNYIFICFALPYISIAQELIGTSPVYQFNITKKNLGKESLPSNSTLLMGKPNISITDYDFLSPGNIYRPGYPFTLELKFKNNSKHPAQNLIVEFILPRHVYAAEKIIDIGNLAPYESVEKKFHFTVYPKYRGSEVPISINFKANHNYLSNEKVVLPFITVIKPNAFSPHRKNKDKAIFFAVQDYGSSTKKTLGNLDNPIDDANKIAKELEENFDFNTEVIKNPTFKEITEKLKEFKKAYQNGEFDPNGQLFIFFSGHGFYNSGNGYFLPVDAKPDDFDCENCFSYQKYNPILSRFECKHILVAIDACYSGTFDVEKWKDVKTIAKRPKELNEIEIFYQNHLDRKTRSFLTSGDNEKTPDKSEFTKSFLTGLRNAYKKKYFITTGELFEQYIKKGTVSTKSQFGNFGDNDAGSSFLFFMK